MALEFEGLDEGRVSRADLAGAVSNELVTRYVLQDRHGHLSYGRRVDSINSEHVTVIVSLEPGQFESIMDAARVREVASA